MAMIRHYSFGSIDVDGHKYESDLIIYPDRIEAGWWRKEGHRLYKEDVKDVLADPPEVLVVGLGESGRMVVDDGLTRALEELNIRLVAAPTKAACNAFNKLSKDGTRVVAALHLTC